MATKNEYRYERGNGPRDRSLRVGDREREAVADMLRHHHVEGRLDADEFQERLECCLAAKTYRELDELIADFPGPEPQRRRRLTGTRPLWWIAPVPLIPLLVIAAIALSAGHLVWLVFPLAFFVLRPLAWRSWGRGRGGAWGCGRGSSSIAEPRA